MDATEVKQFLSSRIESVVEHLLPDGKRSRREWCVGSLSGDKGKSLNVSLEGERAGLWIDFATNEKGDILDLWSEVKHLSFKDTMEDIKRHYCLSDQPLMAHRPREYQRPKKPNCTKPIGAVLEYLTTERKLSIETIEAFKVAASPDDKTIIFPFMRNGELIAVKYLDLKRPDGNKKPWFDKDPEPCLFGWHTISDNAREIYICEGEIDAMSLYQYGHPAVSVPNGASGLTWIETEYHNLERFTDIYICFDNDDAGRKGFPEVINRLGRHRCKVVSCYEKDINDCLTAGYDKEAIGTMLQSAQYDDPVQLKRPSDYLHAVIESFYPTGGVEPGVLLPWKKTHNTLRFRPSEVSIWTGMNGHGKSMMLSHLMLDVAHQGEKICIASFEMSPKLILNRLARQACAEAVPEISHIKKAIEWVEGYFLIFLEMKNITPELIFDVFSYAAKRHNVKHFVLDSLMKAGIDEDDYNAQKRFVDQLCHFSHQYNCHVHLVAHPRKGANEIAPVRKMDVAGSGMITNLVDNCFSVWRNKDKEEDAQKPEPDTEKQKLPDAIVYCDKARNGDWEGKVYLWFDKRTRQYLESPYTEPFKYVKDKSFFNAISKAGG